MLRRLMGVEKRFMGAGETDRSSQDGHRLQRKLAGLVRVLGPRPGCSDCYKRVPRSLLSCGWGCGYYPSDPSFPAAVSMSELVQDSGPGSRVQGPTGLLRRPPQRAQKSRGGHLSCRREPWGTACT